MLSRITQGALSLAALGMCTSAFGAKLVEVRTVDDEHLMIHWLDGDGRVQG